MRRSIRLHAKHGVNPKLTYCPRCHGEARELMLIGADDDKFSCRVCETVSFGARKCLKCADGGAGERSKIGEHERLPGGLCDACEVESREHWTEVQAGGVYFKCADCGVRGVIKSGAAFAATVREAHGLAAPKACGVEFSTRDCPQCGPGKEAA
jgi:hypothetical protein